MRAVYKDKNGRTFSAPLELHGDQWLMRTNEGLEKIQFVFQDDEVGRLLFDSFREDQPTPAVEPDTRLHVEGQGFRALQSAVAKHRSQVEAEQSRARTQALNAMNPVAERKTRQARAINNQFAERLKPKREVIPLPQLSRKDLAIAEEYIWRRPKKKDE